MEQHLTQDKEEIVCPFCRHSEGVVSGEEAEAESAPYTPDIVYVKRRKLDGEYKPRGRISVAPHRAKRVTRRLCYVYDYESEDVSSVGGTVTEEVDAALDEAAEQDLATYHAAAHAAYEEYDGPLMHCAETIVLTSDEESVEESKEEVPSYLPSETEDGVEETKDNETHVSETEEYSEEEIWPCEFGSGDLWVTTDDQPCSKFTCRRTACCNRAWCEQCWFYSVMQRGYDRHCKYVQCVGCDKTVYFSGKMIQ